MKLKELRFSEQYLYDKPKEKMYFRGITVFLGIEKICTIEYDEDKHPVTKEEEDDNDFYLFKERKTLTIFFNGILPHFLNEEKLSDQRRFLLEDKELAKKEVYKSLEKYLNFFIK